MTRIFGNDYGKPVACRISTEDYNYLWDIAFARKISMSVIIREFLEQQITEMKVIEARLNRQKENLCEHGRGKTDYCLPCGRINGN